MTASNITGVLFTDMKNKAEENPDFAPLTFEAWPNPDEVLTYADLVLKGNRLIQAMRNLGIGQGDRFSVLMRNHPEFILAMYAASALGAIMVPIDPRSKGHKLQYQIRDSGSVGIIFASEFMEGAKEALAGLPDVKTVGVMYRDYFDIKDSPDFPSLNEILDGPEAPDPDLTGQDPDAPFMIIYTSGTTGDPKGVVNKASRWMTFYMLAQLVWQYNADDVLYNGLSMTHANPHVITLPTALWQSIPAIISRRFTKSRIWDICRHYGCTTYSLLGGMMMGIYSEPEKPDDQDHKVRKVISAGTPRAIWEAFEKRFNVKVHEWYGAMEGGFAHNPPGVGPIGSLGKPLGELIEVQVMRDDDNPCDPFETGELVSRMKSGTTDVEYHEKAEASAEKTRGGWLRSGDMVHRDEDGWIFFDFRKGGGLRRQGDFVMPEHVEAVLATHPDVNDVCVYGVPAASGAPGESDIVAAITPTPGRTPDIRSVFDTCLGGMERNSVPSYIQIVNEIPKSVSEKNLARILEDEFDPDGENVHRFVN